MSCTEPEPADVVALLRAHLARDGEAIEALLDLVDARALLNRTVCFALSWLFGIGMDYQAADEFLRAWQAQHRLGVL